MNVITIFARLEHMPDMTECAAIMQASKGVTHRVSELDWAITWLSDLVDGATLISLN